ncbi:MAG: cobamide remodeling phosphodiesterase CbiR [Kiritimatiellia bacterium]
MQDGSPLPALPTGRSWRLGSTSYVYPADVLPNAERLAGHIQDIELVLFQSPDAANLPSPAVIEQLARLRRAHGFTFTIHFPIDRQLGHPDRAHRAEMLDQIAIIVERVGPLEPFAYIVHPEGITSDAAPGRIAAWQGHLAESIARIVDLGIAPERLAMENLAHPFEWCTPIVESAGISVCIDIGHLWLNQVPVADHLRRWLPRTRVVHLHGEHQGRDHLSLAAADRGRLAHVLQELRGPPPFTGVVTLEVFSFDDTASSIEVLRETIG